ncbi:MAG: hypothetical protein RH862_20180 [Leptospiraceae bacterium]
MAEKREQFEGPFLPFRFLREWQYAWLEYYAWMQATLVGGTVSRIQVNKSMLGDVWKRANGFLGRLMERIPFPAPSIQVGTELDEDSLNEYESEAFDWLRVNYNEVYRGENYKGTVLGMIAQHFQRKGFDLNRLKELSLQDLDSEMQSEGYAGLGNLDDFLEKTGVRKSSIYASIFNESEGARWLAIYDENGQRAGRSYEVTRDMVRDIVQIAIDNDLSLDEIRQELIYASTEAQSGRYINPDGSIDEKGFQELMLKHLNRDMVRVAVTEAAISFNNGLLLQQVHEGGKYVIFT